MQKIVFIFLLVLMSTFELVAQKTITLAFYNTENFFDTVDDPKTSDEEFLPNSPLKWDDAKYNSKIKRIAQVIDSTVIGLALPDAIGLCEIENKKVLDDLIQKSQLKNSNYTSLCTSGLDERGINVGFIFNKNAFDFISSEEINATNPNILNYKTRNILCVTLLLKKTGETIYFFINHWPSRRDGEKETAEKRNYAAQMLRNKIDGLLKLNPKIKIVVMGDLNDTPKDNSILNILQATNNPKPKSAQLFNPYFDMNTNNEGTHIHQKDWQVFDQIILSQGFLQNKNLYFKKGSAYILKKDFVLFKNYKTGEVKPNRTYGFGNKYYNGYSDHLAVYINLNY